jgi:hypothetical protein
LSKEEDFDAAADEAELTWIDDSLAMMMFFLCVSLEYTGLPSNAFRTEFEAGLLVKLSGLLLPWSDDMHSELDALVRDGSTSDGGVKADSLASP